MKALHRQLYQGRELCAAAVLGRRERLPPALSSTILSGRPSSLQFEDRNAAQGLIGQRTIHVAPAPALYALQDLLQLLGPSSGGDLKPKLFTRFHCIHEQHRTKVPLVATSALKEVPNREYADVG